MTNTDNETESEIEVSKSQEVEPALFYVASAFLFLFFCYYSWRQCSILVINYDVGLIALGADLIVSGGTLYRDIHTVMFPGAYLILGACFRIFGSSFFVCQIATTVIIVGVGVLTLTLSKKFINGWNVLLPSALTVVMGAYINPYFSHHWCSVLFVLAFANCLFYFKYKSCSKQLSRIANFCIGFIAGLSILCYQLQLFPVLFCSIVAGYSLNFGNGNSISQGEGAELYDRNKQSANTKNSRQENLLSDLNQGQKEKDEEQEQENQVQIQIQNLSQMQGLKINNFIETTAFLFLGIGTVLLLLLAGLLATGSLNDFIECTIKFVFSHYENVNKVDYGYNNVQESVVSLFKFPLNLFSNMSLGIIQTAPFIVLVGCFYTLLQEKSLKRALTRNTQVTLLIVLAFGLFFGEAIHKPDLRRLVWAMPIMLVAVFYFAEQIQNKYKSAKILVIAISLMIATGLVLNGKLFMLGKSFLVKSYATNRGVVCSATDLTIVEKVKGLIKPKDKILVYPYDTEIAYLSGGKHPSKYPVLHYRYHTKEQFLSVIDDMERSKVKYVIWNRMMDNKNFPDLGWPNYKPVPDSDLIMEPYLETKYKPVKQYGNYLLMVRK